MKGVARKSWRQEPGEESDCPPPSAPAAVCWGERGFFRIFSNWLVVCFFYHGKTVAKPQWLPILWTVGNVHILAVNCDHIGLHLAHHTPEHIDCCISALYSDSKHKPRYKLWNGVFGNRHHRNRFVGRQPVGFVVSARVVAHIVEIAEKERHRVELSHTRPSASCIF